MKKFVPINVKDLVLDAVVKVVITQTAKGDPVVPQSAEGKVIRLSETDFDLMTKPAEGETPAEKITVLKEEVVSLEKETVETEEIGAPSVAEAPAVVPPVPEPVIPLPLVFAGDTSGEQKFFQGSKVSEPAIPDLNLSFDDLLGGFDELGTLPPVPTPVVASEPEPAPVLVMELASTAEPGPVVPEPVPAPVVEPVPAPVAAPGTASLADLWPIPAPVTEPERAVVADDGEVLNQDPPQSVPLPPSPPEEMFAPKKGHKPAIVVILAMLAAVIVLALLLLLWPTGDEPAAPEKQASTTLVAPAPAPVAKSRPMTVDVDNAIVWCRYEFKGYLTDQECEQAVKDHTR